MTIKDLKLNDIGKKLLLAFIFIVPIFWAAKINVGHSSIRLFQEQIFQIGALALYAIILLENVYLSAFILLSIVLYFTHYMCGDNYLVNIFYGCLIYQISYRVIDEDNVDQVFKTILWMGILNILWMILQNLGIDFIFHDLSRPNAIMNNIGFMGLKCFMGMFFAFALPFALYFNPWIALLLLVPIGLSESSISMIASACVLIVYFWWSLSKKSKAIFAGVFALLVILAGAYTYKDSKMNMMTDRFNLWKIVLHDAFKKPVSGWGMDSFRNISADGEKDFNYFKNEDNVAFRGIYIRETGQYIFPNEQMFKGNIVHPWDNPHNEFIQLLFEFGLFGVALLIFLGKDIISRFNYADQKQRAIILFFLSFLICSTAQFPLHVARLGLFLPVMLGIYYKLTDEEKKLGEALYGS